jgi:hypothetical protein
LVQTMSRGRVIDWLLEPTEPSIRYLTARDLFEPRPSKRTLSKLQSAIPKKGWAARILSLQREKTWWATNKTCYRPKFRSTIWQLQVLADLGLTRKDERIANAVEFWFDLHLAKDGGYSGGVVSHPLHRGRGHLCMTGNMARSLIRFGYLKDERIQSAINWLVNEQLLDGGWDCFGRPKGTIDGWEAMSAFAEVPVNKRSPQVRRAIERGAEFFLKRRLIHEGRPSRTWVTLHYPWHYIYDYLVGLDFMTRLGYGRDDRMQEAFTMLISARRPDGRWNLNGNNRYPYLEQPGQPSKMITFLALRALKHNGRKVAVW